MYAHVDGKSTVGVGVDFCHVRPDYFGKVFFIPFAYAGLEHGDDRRRINFGPGRGAPGDNVLQFGFADAEPIKFGFQFRHDQAGQHGVDAVRDLLLNLGQFGLLCLQVGGGPVDLIGDILGRFGEVYRPQVFLQVLHHESLNFVGVDILRPAGMRPVLIAAAVVPRRIPFFVCAGVAHIGGPAFFTFDQARQQVLVAGFITSGSFVVLHSGLYLLPCVVVNDRRDRALYALHVWIVLTACPFPHDLVFLFVPGVDAYVPLILQHTVQTVFTDRPAALAGGPVQVVDNVVVAFAVGVPVEDLPDNPGLCRIDHIVAADYVVAQGRDAAQELALLRLHGHAVDRLLPGAQDFDLAHAHGDQFGEEVGAVRQVAQFLAGGTDHLNAQVHHSLAEGEPVADVAAAAAYVVNDHRAELLPVRCGHQGLEALPVGVGAAARFILEGGDDLDAVFSGEFADTCLLVGDTVFCLIVCGVPHILRSGQYAETS